jgi:4-deoxy-L-threo-5-hexosulose-uronate ketol-isomerase
LRLEIITSTNFSKANIMSKGRRVIMEIRNPIHPEHGKGLTTKQLRKEFLIQGLFTEGAFKLVYSHFDRIMVGGVCPKDPICLEVSQKVIGASFLLERREMGIINIEARGKVSVDGTNYELERRDGLYVGMGSKEILFSSVGKGEPAMLKPSPSTWVLPRKAIRGLSISTSIPVG